MVTEISVLRSISFNLRNNLLLYKTSILTAVLLICNSFVFRARGIVCVVYLLIRLANFKDTLVLDTAYSCIEVTKFFEEVICRAVARNKL